MTPDISESDPASASTPLSPGLDRDAARSKKALGLKQVYLTVNTLSEEIPMMLIERESEFIELLKHPRRNVIGQIKHKMKLKLLKFKEWLYPRD